MLVKNYSYVSHMSDAELCEKKANSLLNNVYHTLLRAVGISKLQDDTYTAALYYEKAAKFYMEQSNDLVKCIECLNKSADIYNELNYIHKSMELFMDIARLYRKLERYDDALFYYNKCLLLHNKDICIKKIPKILEEMSEICVEDLRLKYLIEACKYYLLTKNILDYTECSWKVGGVYLKRNEYINAYEHFHNSYTHNLFQSHEIKYLYGVCISMIGSVYFEKSMKSFIKEYDCMGIVECIEREDVEGFEECVQSYYKKNFHRYYIGKVWEEKFYKDIVESFESE